MTLLALADECAGLMREAALPLPARLRPRFLERVSELLRNEEILIPARVMSACQQAQRELLFAPADPSSAIDGRP